MKRYLLLAVTATVLALSPVATVPAKAAETRDIIGAIIGIAAIGAIAHQISKNRKEQRGQPDRRKTYDDRRQWRHDDRRGHGNGYRQARVLPGQCLRVLDGGRQDGIVFPERCLWQSGVRRDRLPRHCETQIQTYRGPVDVYPARCLARAGWTLPRLAQR
jgi:hypothetical protein